MTALPSTLMPWDIGDSIIICCTGTSDEGILVTTYAALRHMSSKQQIHWLFVGMLLTVQTRIHVIYTRRIT